MRCSAYLPDLMLASQCDLLITNMLTGEEDSADVPPIDEDTPDGAAARALPRWATSGAVLSRYGRLVPATRLRADQDAIRLADIARELAAGRLRAQSGWLRQRRSVAYRALR
jgi:hypothetical protein